MRRLFGGKFERRFGVLGRFTADGPCYQSYFSWRYPQISKMCFIFFHIDHFLAGAAAAALVFSASAACCSNSFCILPPCLVNFLVGENSPNLWPTSFFNNLSSIYGPFFRLLGIIFNS